MDNPTPERDLAISFISPANCSSLFAKSLAQTMLYPTVAARVASLIHAPSGPLIAEARTGVVDSFLSHPTAQWLLQIDADMLFDPITVQLLVESGDRDKRPIVGGNCRGTGQSVTSYATEAGWYGPAGQIQWLNPDAVGLVNVDFVGAGALLVHRTVYERLAEIHPRPQPWFQEEVYDGRCDGEDWTFCRRAKASGFPIHTNIDAAFGHHKTSVIWPQRTNGQPIGLYRREQPRAGLS